MLIFEIRFYKEFVFFKKFLKLLYVPIFQKYTDYFYKQTKRSLLKGEGLGSYSRPSAFCISAYLRGLSSVSNVSENTLYKCRNKEIITYIKVVFLQLFKLKRLF